MKALVRSAEIAYLSRRAGEFGFQSSEVIPDFGAIIARKDRIVSSMSTGESNLRRRGIDRLRGSAAFASPNTLEIEGSRYDSKSFVIATGAEPVIPDIPGLAETGYWTNQDAINPDRQPESLIIIGGSAQGCEFAQIYARLGTRVTIIEMRPTLLAGEDPELSAVLLSVFEDEGIDCILGANVAEISGGHDEKTVRHVSDGREGRIAADEILLAAGRRPAVAGLGLEAAGVDTKGPAVKVDKNLRTSQSHIWACGDSMGDPMFAHMASYEGSIAGMNCVAQGGGLLQADYRVVPHAIFTDPPCAAVGLTEDEALEAGYEVTVGRAAFSDSGRAASIGETRGLVKLVADASSQELLGAHIVGPGADMLIHEAIIAMGSRLAADALLRPKAIHVHPTLSEVVTLAAAEIK